MEEQPPPQSATATLNRTIGLIAKYGAPSQLRNEGWSDDELKAYFGTGFRDRSWTRHGDALYWVSVICMYTGARRDEIAGMKVADLEKRHGVRMFFFARQHGKTEESRRISSCDCNAEGLVRAFPMMSSAASFDSKCSGLSRDIQQSGQRR